MIERLKTFTMASLGKLGLCCATVGLAACLFVTQAQAAAEDHGRIRAVAEAHALVTARSFAPDGARVAVEVAPLDPRLNLPACPFEPETFDPPGQRPSAHLSIGVRCTAVPAWSLYVPVRVDITVDVVVLAAAVAQGQTLESDALRYEARDVARLGGAYLTRIDEAQGMVLRQSVRPGTVLTSRQLERPKLVRRGQRVQLVAQESGLAVGSQGEALTDAAEGDRVRVRNMSSLLIVEGVVDGDGRVRTGS